MMSPQQTKMIGILFVLGFILFSAINFFYLKSTVTWPEEMLEDSTEVEEEYISDDLNLTWDISGEEGPRNPEKERYDMEKRELERQEETMAMVDSVITTETSPIQEEITDTQENLMNTQQQLNELERLIALISTQADSVDQSNARRLSKVIEKMKPVDAAGIMIGLGDRTNAELLLRMKQRQAARILAALPRERAAEVARYLSRAYARSSI